MNADAQWGPIEPSTIKQCIHNLLCVELASRSYTVQIALNIALVGVQDEPVLLGVRKPPKPQEVQDADRLKLRAFELLIQLP
jgi:hypothetical protein